MGKASGLIQVLNQKEMDLLHESSLRVLEEIGMRIQHTDALTALAEAGCRVDPERQVVTFPTVSVKWELLHEQKSQ